MSNEVELIKDLKPAELRLFIALKEHLNEVLEGNHKGLGNSKKWLEYYLPTERERVLNTNIIYLSEKFLYDYEVIDPAKFSKKGNAAYKARSFIKRLVKAGVVAKYWYPNKKYPSETYIINPTYLYMGSKLASCFEDWCRVADVNTTNPLVKKTVQGVDKRCDPKTRVHSTLPNRFDREHAALAGRMFSPADLPEDIMEQVEAKQSFEEQQPIKQAVMGLVGQEEYNQATTEERAKMALTEADRTQYETHYHNGIELPF